MAAFILNMYVRGFQEIIQTGLIEEERGGTEGGSCSIANCPWPPLLTHHRCWLVW